MAGNGGALVTSRTIRLARTTTRVGRFPAGWADYAARETIRAERGARAGGGGHGLKRECREDNNAITLHVACP